MTGYTDGNLQSPARAATATIALVAGSYLAASATTAQPAASEGEARNGGWLTQVWRGASQPAPAASQADAQYVGAYSKDETEGDPAARKRRKGEGREALFPPGPQ